MSTILIIEDEQELVKVLRSYLEQAGFNVLAAMRGDTGLSTWEQKQPDLVILDLNLPGMDGLDVARVIRRKADTPVVMLTARVEEMDQLIGLELGADDYVSKPFEPKELVSRVKAVLRRYSVKPKRSLIRIGDFTVDVEKRQVWRGDLEIQLTTLEFDLLKAMAETPGRVYSRMQLLDKVQGEAYEGYERTIDSHIKNLRKKIEPDAEHPRYIITVYGVGYKVVGGTDA